MTIDENQDLYLTGLDLLRDLDRAEAIGTCIAGKSPVAPEPDSDLDLAYEGRINAAPPPIGMAQFRLRVVGILLDSIEHLACDYPPLEPWSVHRADTIREQIGKARYEIAELRAGR